MKIRFILFGVFISLMACFTGCSWLGNFTEKPILSVEVLNKKADQLLSRLEQQDELSGAVLIAKNDEIVLCKGYGMADWEHNIRITPETRFGIGSITKSFTAMLILLLAQDCKLNLDDPVQKYLKDFKHPNVTIMHLLTHSSGLPREAIDLQKDTSLEEDAWGVKHTSPTKKFYEKSYAEYAVTLGSQPGKKFEYSNSGFRLLSFIINQLDGSYASSLEKRICKPLGLTSTDACLQASNKNIVAAMAKKPSLILHGSYSFGEDIVDGAGSIISTVKDMYRFAKCIKNNELLSPEFAQIYKTAHIPMSEDNKEMGYACGLIVSQFNNKQSIWHNGGRDYFSSAMSISTYPKTKDDLIIVILTNQGTLEIADTVVVKIEDLIEQKNVNLRKNTSVIPQADAKQYEGIYHAQAKKGQPPFEDIMIKAKRDDTLWAISGSGDMRLQLEKDDVFGANIIFGGFTYTFVHKDGKVVGFNEQFAGMNIEFRKIKELADYVASEDRVAVEVDPEIYDQYVGKYKLQENFIITITKENNALFAQATGQGKIEIYPEAETEFFYKIVDAQISFIKDKSGKVTKLILHQGGIDRAAEKIE